MALEGKVKAASGRKHERRLRIGTFAGLCSERKQKEVGQIVVNDVVTGQESWETDGFTVNVYRWI